MSDNEMGSVQEVSNEILIKTVEEESISYEKIVNGYILCREVKGLDTNGIPSCYEEEIYFPDAVSLKAAYLKIANRIS